MNKLKALLIKSNGQSEEVTIDNTLESLQKAVGGYIETCRICTDAVAIVNEEGRLLGLPVNRALPFFVGDVLIVGDDGSDEFASLSADQIVSLRRIIKGGKKQ